MNTHRVPMRWRDLDTLNHVNNVVHIHYAMEAWPELRTTGVLPGGRPRRATVEFKMPVLMGPEPMRVESTVNGTVLEQAVSVAVHAHAAATVVTDFDQTLPTDVPVETRAFARPLSLRYADLDREAQVDMATTFELFQETRVPFFRAKAAEFGTEPLSVVLARVDADLLRPIAWQEEPLEGRTWIQRVGNSSFDVGAQLVRDGEVLATSRAVLVAFDPTTQRAAGLPDAAREMLLAAVLD